MESYDYIVIGAGSAGCVVARRLSDNPGLRVLLLEAGPPADDFWIRTPAGMGKLFKHDDYNWKYFTEPVPTLRDRRIYWPRGKALGGSSAINGMVYVRGHRGDFDHWESLGNKGWGWEGVLPYFKRAESNRRIGGPFWGTDGPLIISDPAVKHPSAFAFLEAAARNGIPTLDEINGVEEHGAGFLQATIADGIRQSAYSAYIDPIKARSNLVVKTNAHVRRIVIENKQATGVEVIEDREIHTISARREVILCAGALNSPHVLMLSGIGDGRMLQRYGITTIVDAKGVGKNLQDHFVVRVQAKANRASSYNHALSGWRKYWEGARYVATHRGYLALGSSMAAAFVKSGPDVPYADLEISFRPMTFRYLATGSVEVDSYPGVSASVYNMRPASRGEINLQSEDPLMPPSFNPNYLGDRADVGVMLAGLRKIRSIFATEPMASRVFDEIAPGKTVANDEQLIDYMEREGQCAFHPAGSCKMGNDEMAVVDAELRVYGVDRLRVVDASIMPTVTSGNTNAPSIMIGEKGADLIVNHAAQARTVPA
ncbi:GMC family oxidoreductase [Caballeronia novacaledonica]|uniref:Choline dehydrogenase n=1 Tax=Caballeronia novacaledonica TaxID=1544861 RepID=A0AA37ICU4_9BURK|nr:GMC family oxidoreductase N-terminal domain-containing protein [Caballeronia novacaledonica]GJH27023.1 choline dehydrogenase [Caballeronia novacaledonica]